MFGTIFVRQIYYDQRYLSKGGCEEGNFMGEVSKPGPVVLSPAPQAREETGKARGLSFTLPGASECGFESRAPGWAASTVIQYESARYVSSLFSYCAEPADLSNNQRKEL